MKKLTLTKMIIPLALAIASSFAMAEDGSDYALSSAPRAQAPKMVPQSAHQDPYYVRAATAGSLQKAENPRMKCEMMTKDCAAKMHTMGSPAAAE
jgi:ectoine hydroxylase-related dioxygenase (phytanoyl-CoA dioxygenase family)